MSRFPIQSDYPSQQAGQTAPLETAERPRSHREREQEEKRLQARQLFLMGLSYRDIAERIGLKESGYVTVARWVKRYDWQAEREELVQQDKATRKQTYLHRVSSIQDAHLRLGARIRQAAELALEAYLETNEEGEIIGIKTNPRTGLPAISPFAIQQFIAVAADLERKALGVELLPAEEMQQLATPVVDATPIAPEQQALLKRMGDYLAQASLTAPTEPTSASDDDLNPGQPSRADTLQETVAPDMPPAL